jgi:hypothetical protein
LKAQTHQWCRPSAVDDALRVPAGWPVHVVADFRQCPVMRSELPPIHSPRHRPSPCSPLKAPLKWRSIQHGGLGNHAIWRRLAAHVQNRSYYVACAPLTRGVPGALAAVFFKTLGQGVGVLAGWPGARRSSR